MKDVKSLVVVDKLQVLAMRDPGLAAPDWLSRGIPLSHLLSKV